MHIYSLMAERYDEIFPLDHAVVDFIRSSVTEASGPMKALDVGCATGSLARALASDGWEVTGIDTDETMLAAARERAAGADRLRFIAGDMRRLETAFPAASFDVVLCLGNTLVHLEDERAMGKFLGQARALLAPGGNLLIQIMNYDFILAGDLRPFPDVETASLVFRRSYARRDDGRLDFHISLTDKQAGRTHVGEFPLYPLTHDALARLLEEAGFTGAEFFGDFKRGPWSAESRLLVTRASTV